MIAGRCRSLLEHLGPTVALTDLRRSEASDRVALRHDIDHDLGVALDMSAMEREIGDRRATYFILHTQGYCEDETFLDRLRQLVDDGHEIGLHLDALGAWWRGETDDPFGDLERWLDRVRDAGIAVVGSAAHGARACYDGGFANHWIWSELRGDDPAATMKGISAEGIVVEQPEYQLPYPTDHRLRRGDGATIDLWTRSMASYGIEYEACTVPVDRYWSDSGGAWKRSPDPMEHDLSRGRHQVLVHPWWWREPRRDVVVLGTARSGTKWLCGLMKAGTSAVVLHERTLNQDGRSLESCVGLKRTAGDLVGLLDDGGRVKKLVDDAFVARHRGRRDSFEANVYLPHVDPALLAREGTTIVHVHRDPARVVRSILERGWYDAPDDRRHPRFEIAGREGGWEGMTRVEKACTYWAETNRALLRSFPDAIRVSAEDLHSDAEAVQDLASRLDLDWHEIPGSAPAPAVDRTESWTIPAVEDWNDRDRRAFLDICGPVAAVLGRGLSMSEPATPGEDGMGVAHGAAPAGRRLRRGPTHRCRWRPWYAGRARVEGESGPGAWFGLSSQGGWDGGPAPRSPLGDLVVAGAFQVGFQSAGLVARLFAIGVDASGRVVERRPLLRLEPDREGRCGGRFSVRFADPGVVDAHPVVLLDAVEGAWTASEFTLDWRAAAMPTTSIACRAAVDPEVAEPSSADRGPGMRTRSIAACRRLDSSDIADHRQRHERRRLFDPADYEFLLADFADHEKMTLAEYAAIEEVADRRILLIRHDVDHDLETALRMAAWESERGIRTTYCLLHTAWYWGDFDGRRYRRTRDLVEAGDRLLELGHEINLHNNLATLALQTGCDPARVLEAELGFMRSLGWPVVGTATHGDRLCHELTYGNFELFEHAVKPDRGGPRRLFTDHGAVSLGRLRQEDFGIEYEAYDIHRDLYISDSGGRMRGQRDAPGRRGVRPVRPVPGSGGWYPDPSDLVAVSGAGDLIRTISRPWKALALMLGSLVSWLPRRRVGVPADPGPAPVSGPVARVVDGHGVDFVADLLDRIDLPCIRMHEVADHPGPALHVRHDVDHSIEKAIMIAGVERAAGYASTYFLLTPGAYKDRNYYGTIDRRGRIEHDSDLADKCRRLLDLGHDLGFHNDLVALSLNTGRPAAEILREEIDWFDAQGLHLRGMAAHGNPLCRRLSFNNRELFAGCVRRGWEVGRTIRHEGREVLLHSLDMEDFGFEYEAYSLPRDSRISESGGRWGGRVAGEQVPKEEFAAAFDLERFRALAESASPRNGVRHMSVMTHPIYWNGCEEVQA